MTNGSRILDSAEVETTAKLRRLFQRGHLGKRPVQRSERRRKRPVDLSRVVGQFRQRLSGSSSRPVWKNYHTLMNCFNRPRDYWKN